jgi:hypothetical protein
LIRAFLRGSPPVSVLQTRHTRLGTGADDTDHIQPHLTPLSQVFNINIESQILYHAPLTFEPIPEAVPHSTQTNRDIDAAVDRATNGDVEAAEIAEEFVGQAREDELRGWGIDEDMMKVFVNSERWSLGEWPSVSDVGCDNLLAIYWTVTKSRLWKYE